jgi:hypothetical protein
VQLAAKLKSASRQHVIIMISSAATIANEMMICQISSSRRGVTGQLRVAPLLLARICEKSGSDWHR